MTRVDDGRLRIVITGDVRVTNRGLDSSTASMTGERFEVFAAQLPEAVEEQRVAGAARESFDLGGQLELEKIIGRKGVFITTPPVRSSAGDLDYDVKNGMARLAGQPGRVVTVLTRGEKLPYSAEVVRVGHEARHDPGRQCVEHGGPLKQRPVCGLPFTDRGRVPRTVHCEP